MYGAAHISTDGERVLLSRLQYKAQPASTRHPPGEEPRGRARLRAKEGVLRSPAPDCAEVE